MAALTPPRPAVFVNCPFVESYERLFVSLIAGLTALGRVPSVSDMMFRYRKSWLEATHLRKTDRVPTLFAPRPFRQLVVTGASLADAAGR